jgi:hypothetical protein
MPGIRDELFMNTAVAPPPLTEAGTCQPYGDESSAGETADPRSGRWAELCR